MAPVLALLPLLLGGLVPAVLGVAVSGSYVPVPLPCSNGTQYVRPASEGLSSAEQAWLKKRQPKVINALESYLQRANISGFNTSAYISALQNNVSATPRIGMTFSGGGQRARTIGLGAYYAFDNRNPLANAAGTGGLSQALTYVAGLSGGSQTLVVLAMSDFSSPHEILGNGNLVDPSANQTAAAFNDTIVAKWASGFNVTFADLFAASQFANLLTNSSTIDPYSRLFSDVRYLPNFANGSTPLPFVMMTESIPQGLPGSLNYNGYLYPAFNVTNTTFYEASPFEWGSWEQNGRARAFADLAYLGTQFSAGQPTNQSACINGFDNAAFISSTSLQATNLWIVQVATNGTQGQFDRRRSIDLVKRQSNSTNGNPPWYGPSYPPNEVRNEQIRVTDGTLGFVDGVIPQVADLPFWNNASVNQLTWAQWNNPWQNYNVSDSALQSQDSIYLQDGSETGQINPLWPIIQKERSPDFLIVSDNSGTELTSGWMNGTNFQATYAIAAANGLPFPEIPDAMTMVNNNYTVQSTLFGCNEPNVPLVLYLADAPWTAYSNVTKVLDSNLTSRQINLLWDNTLANVAQMNSTRTNWPACIACAAIYRSLQRLNISVPQTCQSCFSSYCWNGTYTSEPARFVSPPLRLKPSLDFNTWNQTVWSA